MGVAGATLQSGEVLDMDFFMVNPTGDTTPPPCAHAMATSMILTLDNFGTEDLVVVLKLVDPDDNSTTTKAIIVDTGDVFTDGSPPPSGFGLTLDGNDGAIIIESNDYNFGLETG